MNPPALALPVTFLVSPAIVKGTWSTDRSSGSGIGSEGGGPSEEPLMVKSAAPAAVSPDLCCKKERQLLRTM